MKELIQQHGVQVSIVLVLACYNIAMTAVKTIIEKVDAYLGKNPSESSLYKWVDKSVGFVSGIIDWLTGNKEH